MFNSKKIILLFLLFIFALSSSAQTARQIIIINVSATQTAVTVNYVLWIVPTNANPLPSFVSAVSNATPSEIAALRAGTTLELPGSTDFSVTGFTKANMQASLQKIFTAAQTSATSAPAPVFNPLLNCSFNGSIWSC